MFRVKADDVANVDGFLIELRLNESGVDVVLLAVEKQFENLIVVALWMFRVQVFSIEDERMVRVGEENVI